MNLLKKQVAVNSVQFYLLFFYLGGVIGFVLGSVLFWGPIRWTIEYLQEEGAPDKAESFIIKVFIVVILLISAAISFFISKRYWESEKQSKRWMIFFPTFFFAAVIFLWMNPQYTPGRSERSENISLARISFVFGPYPSKEQIFQLKKENYAGIISLLHPAVVPFEPKLIFEEDAAAHDAGIEIIHTPMLPWVSQNIASIETIKKLVAVGKGKYYVHCYLGKDRVNVVKRIIESQNVAVDATNVSTYRTLNEINKFAEGPLFYLGKAVHLLPHPTEEECLGYLLSGYVRQVVSLIDDETFENRELSKKDSLLYSSYALKYLHYPFNLKKFNYERLSVLLDSIKTLPKPLALIIKTTTQAETGMLVQAIQATYSINKFDILNLFGSGEIVQLYPNIYFGPEPTTPQRKELSSHGIQNLVFLSAKENYFQKDNESNLVIYSLRTKRKLDSLLFNGAWYLCGTTLDQTRKLFSY